MLREGREAVGTQYVKHLPYILLNVAISSKHINSQRFGIHTSMRNTLYKHLIITGRNTAEIGRKWFSFCVSSKNIILNFPACLTFLYFQEEVTPKQNYNQMD